MNKERILQIVKDHEKDGARGAVDWHEDKHACDLPVVRRRGGGGGGGRSGEGAARVSEASGSGGGGEGERGLRLYTGAVLEARALLVREIEPMGRGAPAKPRKILWACGRTFSP